MKRIGLLILCFTFFTFLSSCSDNNQEKDVLRVTAIPDEDATELIRKAKPLMKYLENSLQMQVKFLPVSDYSAAVEAIVNRKVDLAWFGGLTFIQAYSRSNGQVEPIIQRVEDQSFRSVFITSDETIKSLSDLKGKEIMFGSQSSTSGHLMPRTFLMNEGIVPEKDFKRVAYSGAHDATIAAVGSGKVQAGAMNIKTWKRFLREKRVPEGTKVFYTTPPYYNYNWTIHLDVPEKLRLKIKEAFLAVSSDQDEGSKILEAQDASGFVETEKKNYYGLKSAAESVGLIKTFSN